MNAFKITKMDLAHILGDFFPNASGHPDLELVFNLFTKFPFYFHPSVQKSNAIGFS
jgi:hypothetical protein